MSRCYIDLHGGYSCCSNVRHLVFDLRSESVWSSECKVNLSKSFYFLKRHL